MSNLNDKNENSGSSEKNSKFSPVKNLFRSGSHSDEYEGEPIKDIFDNYSPSKKRRQKESQNSGFGTFKSHFNNFLQAMQQQPEENFDDIPPVKSYSETAQTHQPKPVKDDVKVYKPKNKAEESSVHPHQTKLKEQNSSRKQPKVQSDKADRKNHSPQRAVKSEVAASAEKKPLSIADSEQVAAKAEIAMPAEEKPLPVADSEQKTAKTATAVSAEEKPLTVADSEQKTAKTATAVSAEEKPLQIADSEQKAAKTETAVSAEEKPLPITDSEQTETKSKVAAAAKEKTLDAANSHKTRTKNKPIKTDHQKNSPVVKQTVPVIPGYIPNQAGYDIKAVTSSVEERLKAETLAQQHNNHKNKKNHKKDFTQKQNDLKVNVSQKEPFVVGTVEVQSEKKPDNVIYHRSNEPQKKIDKPSESNLSEIKTPDPDDDIKIIPWNHTKTSDSPKKTETAGTTSVEPKDFSEGYINGEIYHESSNPPFIVMAGKFTKTVRNEYVYIREYKKALKQKANEQKAAEKPEPEHQPRPTKPTAVIPNKVRETRPVKNKRAAFEPLEIPRKTKSSAENVPKSPPVDNKKKISETPKKDTPYVITERGARPPMPEMRKKRYHLPKFNMKEMFSGEEEFDPEDTVVEEETPKTVLDDYNKEDDADEIRTEIGTTYRQLFVRTFTLGVLAVVSIIFAFIAQQTSLFSEMWQNGWLMYAFISFVLFSVAAIVSRVTIVNGMMPLRHFKGNSDTAVAVAAFAAAVQSITALFTPYVFVNKTFHIYVPFVITALFANALGKLLIMVRTRDNFKFLAKPYPKFAGKIYTDVRNAEKMVSEFPNRKTIIGYFRRSKFISNFLRMSHMSDPSESMAARVAPFTTVAALVCGIANGILTMNFAAGVSSFALTACVGSPFMCLLAINIPLLKLCRNTLKSGAMVTSYETVKQFCDTNTIMIDSSHLYPKGTVTLSGMKVFSKTELNDAITAGAAMMYKLNGTMCGVFDNIVQCSKNMLPAVDSIVYEDGKCMVGWVDGRRVLIGNRELLFSHGIKKIPEKSYEDRYRDDINDIMYITVGGNLIVMFMLAYKPNRDVIHELRNLEENGVSFIIRSLDPNVNKESIAKKFYLYNRCITILPTGLGNICNEALSSVDESSRSYLVTRGKLSSFAKAVSGCIRIKSTVFISTVLQYVSVVSALILVTVISFVSGFDKLGSLELLTYTGFWNLAAILMSMIKK